MKLKNSTDRHGSVSVGLHWLTLAVLLGVYACIDLTDLYLKGSDTRESLKRWHLMLGLTVLALVAWRLLSPIPAVTPPVPRWQQRLASGIHITLYALMIVMPFLGWLILSASGKPVPFFGSQLPALLAANESLAAELKAVHEILGTVGYFLIGAHAMAALFHHFVTRDNTLVRILPGRP